MGLEFQDRRLRPLGHPSVAACPVWLALSFVDKEGKNEEGAGQEAGVSNVGWPSLLNWNMQGHGGLRVHRGA